MFAASGWTYSKPVFTPSQLRSEQDRFRADLDLLSLGWSGKPVRCEHRGAGIGQDLFLPGQGAPKLDLELREVAEGWMYPERAHALAGEEQHERNAGDLAVQHEQPAIDDQP